MRLWLSLLLWAARHHWQTRRTPDHPGWDTPDGWEALARIVRETTEEREAITPRKPVPW